MPLLGVARVSIKKFWSYFAYDIIYLNYIRVIALLFLTYLMFLS